MSDTCDPVDYSPPGFYVCGILQASILEWVVVVQLLSRVRLLVTRWTTAHQTFPLLHCLSDFTQSLSIKFVMLSSYLLLCCPLLLPPSILPSIRVFSNESAFCIRWTKYWSFNFSISPSSEYSGLISYRITGLISLQSKGLSRVFSNTTVQKH